MLTWENVPPGPEKIIVYCGGIMKEYVADRDFNEVRKGQVLELEDDHPYLATGYLQPKDQVEALDAEARPVPEEVVGTTADQDAWDAANADDGLEDDEDEDDELDEEDDADADESASGAGSSARPRGRR